MNPRLPYPYPYKGGGGAGGGTLSWSPTTCSCLTKISKSVRKKADAMTNRDGLLGRPRAGECLSLVEIAGLGAAAGAVEAGR